MTAHHVICHEMNTVNTESEFILQGPPGIRGGSGPEGPPGPDVSDLPVQGSIVSNLVSRTT